MRARLLTLLLLIAVACFAGPASAAGKKAPRASAPLRPQGITVSAAS